jgi:hypothetical protein
LYGQQLPLVLEHPTFQLPLIKDGNGVNDGFLKESSFMVWVLRPFTGQFGK